MKKKGTSWKKSKTNLQNKNLTSFKIGPCAECNKILFNYMSFVTMCTSEVQKYKLLCYECYSKS